MDISMRFWTDVGLVAMAAVLGGFLTAAPQSPSSDSEFRAPDGSFTCPIPGGWRVRSISMGGTPIHVFEPNDVGEDRILVASGPAVAGTIQELTQQTMQFVSQQLLPGMLPAGAPNYTQMAGAPAAEIVYRGMTTTGQVSWWQGLMLKDNTYYTVLGGSRAERAALVEKQSRAIFRGLRPGQVRPSSDLAAAIIGTWTFYDRSGLTKGSSSKQITFYPNGRFEYTATTYMPDLPVDVDPTTRASGQYRLNGNTLIAQLDNGQVATYTLQLVQGGGLTINGELFIRER